MPYVITTSVQPPMTRGRLVRSRRAVATRDEVRGLIEEAVYEITAEPVAAEIPVDGGSVGPLSDGTVIEVERLDYRELGKRAELGPTTQRRMKPIEFIDAYNAREVDRAA